MLGVVLEEMVVWLTYEQCFDERSERHRDMAALEERKVKDVFSI